MTKASKFAATTQSSRDDAPRHHFFASSMLQWEVSYSLSGLLDKMQRAGQPFNLYLVPGPVDADYQIEGYAPQVEGVIWLSYHSRHISN